MDNAQGPCSSHVRPDQWFEEWREPGEFFHAANEGITTYFCADKAPPQYLREAYVAGAFARIWRDDRGPCVVCLVPKANRFPDAHLKTDDTRLNLEITMALPKGKRMFKEWWELKKKAARGEFEPAQTSEQRQEHAREAIPRVVGEKAGKRYAEAPILRLCASSSANWAAMMLVMRRL